VSGSKIEAGREREDPELTLIAFRKEVKRLIAS
jgi:hypothetical protein